MSDADLALGIAQRSPNGTTDATFAMLGIGREVIDELVAAGKLRARTIEMAKPKGLRVTWYFPVD